MKNCEEWSVGFDQLYNNITSNKAPGLNEYEKSVFLTNAQEAVVIGLYNGTFGESFESTEAMTSYLAPLVKQVTLEKLEGDTLPHATDRSYIFALPTETDESTGVLFLTFESCKIDVPGCGEVVAIVNPVTQDELWRTMRNPFKKQNQRKVLRLEYAVSEVKEDGSLQENKFIEVISDYPVESYTVRYIARPNPIILEDFDSDLTINGKTEARPCELPEAIHQLILTEAVKAAKAVWLT